MWSQSGRLLITIQWNDFVLSCYLRGNQQDSLLTTQLFGKLSNFWTRCSFPEDDYIENLVKTLASLLINCHREFCCLPLKKMLTRVITRRDVYNYRFMVTANDKQRNRWSISRAFSEGLRSLELTKYLITHHERVQINDEDSLCRPLFTRNHLAYVSIRAGLEHLIEMSVSQNVAWDRKLATHMCTFHQEIHTNLFI